MSTKLVTLKNPADNTETLHPYTSDVAVKRTGGVTVKASLDALETNVNTAQSDIDTLESDLSLEVSTRTQQMTAIQAEIANGVSTVDAILQNNITGSETSTDAYGATSYAIVNYAASKSEVNDLSENKLDKSFNSNEFSITDSNNYIIAKIDENGVHSADFRYGQNDESLITAINNEASTRLQRDNELADLISAETNRVQVAEATKLDQTLASDSFSITDSNGYIVAEIDANGVNGADIRVKDENTGQLVSVKTLIANERERAITEENKKLNHTIEDNKFFISDNNGYKIFQVDSDGVHSAKDKHAVACMVLSESYYPTSTPTRDADGNVTHANITFETGVNGSIDVTYTNGNATYVSIVYGSYTYSITINRDGDGNVETISVN